MLCFGEDLAIGAVVNSLVAIVVAYLVFLLLFESVRTPALKWLRERVRHRKSRRARALTYGCCLTGPVPAASDGRMICSIRYAKPSSLILSVVSPLRLSVENLDASWPVDNPDAQAPLRICLLHLTLLGR